VPSPLNTETLRKALDAYSEYGDVNPYSQDDARDALVDRALNQGFLDDYIEEEIRTNREYNDPDYDPDDYIGPEEVEAYRRRVDSSDFPDRVPFSEDVSIDPDLEEYNVYNFVNQNPKAREYFTNQTINIRGTDAGDRFLRALRAGSFTPEQLRTLRTVRFAGNSDVLENTRDYDAATEAANFVNQNATGRSDIPSIEPVYENTAEALNQIQDLESIAARVNAYSEDIATTQNRLQNISPSNASLASLYESAPRSLTSRQLALPLEVDPYGDRVNEFASRIQSLPLSFNTVAELTDATNRLSSIQRDLGGLVSQITHPSERARAFIAETVLPQVEQALGPYGVQRATRRAFEESRGASMDAAREEDARREYFNLLRRQDSADRVPTAPPADRTPQVQVLESSQGMEPIPGLNAAIQKDRLEAIKRVVSQYPEVERLLASAPKDPQRRPLRGPSVKEYLPYVDREQVISLPEQRKAIYDVLLNSDAEFVNNPALGRSFVDDVESLYTSGNTELQQNALQQLDTRGYGDAMRAVSAPATYPTRPIVGGGKYIRTNDPSSGPEVAAMVKKIRNRAEALDRALPRSEALLREAYPNFSTRPDTVRKLELNYDPDTDSVSLPEPGERGQYGIDVSTGTPRLNPLSALSSMPNNVSLNALRFLADNPVLGTASVSFMTKGPGPGQGYSYEPKELPSAVSDAFGRFAQGKALEGLPPGTLVSNSPLKSRDIVEQKKREGRTADTSSTLRKLEPFIDARQQLPNIRGAAYQTAGFGPYTAEGNQLAYIDANGQVVPLQLTRPEAGLAGSVRMDRSRNTTEVGQGRLPLTTKSYYSIPPEVIAAKGLQELGRGIRQTPSALLPGAADLIPSPEAIQTGYREGPVAMGRQMAQEYAQSLPSAVAAAGVLATPAAAPLAPGIGVGMVGTAAARAVNEVVRQQTGEGIVPKLRQALGTAPRSGVASPQRTTPRPLTASIQALTPAQRVEMSRRQNRNELQRRVDLAKERFNPARLEFGLSELFRGR
jgi:hypothetical protein